MGFHVKDVQSWNLRSKVHVFHKARESCQVKIVGFRFQNYIFNEGNPKAVHMLGASYLHD